MDVRYNIIQWVHRYTRGWSYGDAVVDPRTGEIIKGNVTLGSLRARQDYMIAEGLLSPYVDGKALPAASDPMLKMVLARTRQLAAHETGHTLGLEHNFAASSFAHAPGETVSVMDYPFPYITLDAKGVPDLSEGYGVGIGVWDKTAIDYGYREFDSGGKATEDEEALNRILAESENSGVVLISDEDARPMGGAHPHAHLWDNGTDAADELNRVLGIRSAAIARFGENAIRTGTPMAQLEDTLVPLYLLHRYQTEAAVKLIGGLDFRYALRGDGQLVTRMVPGEDQRRALRAVLATVSPATLTLREDLLRLLPPRPPEYGRIRDSFRGHTGLTFDPLGAAEGAATHSFALLFHPHRAGRLVEHHQRDASLPGLHEVLQAALDATWRAPEQSGLAQGVKLVVEHVALRHLLALAASEEASPLVRAIAGDVVEGLRAGLASGLAEGGADPVTRAHRMAALTAIAAFAKAPETFRQPGTLVPPPGTPI